MSGIVYGHVLRLLPIHWAQHATTAIVVLRRLYVVGPAGLLSIYISTYHHHQLHCIILRQLLAPYGATCLPGAAPNKEGGQTSKYRNMMKALGDERPARQE